MNLTFTDSHNHKIKVENIKIYGVFRGKILSWLGYASKISLGGFKSCYINNNNLIRHLFLSYVFKFESSPAASAVMWEKKMELKEPKNYKAIMKNVKKKEKSMRQK
jgi:hypothetical protein